MGLWDRMHQSEGDFRKLGYVGHFATLASVNAMLANESSLDQKAHYTGILERFLQSCLRSLMLTFVEPCLRLLAAHSL